MASLRQKWHKGQAREYDPIVNRGCCYYGGKVWKPCRFPHRVRIGNDCIRRRVLTMDIDECKSKLSLIFTDIGTMIPYEVSDMPDDWQELSKYIADLASTLSSCISSIAAYSSIASRKAKE